MIRWWRGCGGVRKTNLDHAVSYCNRPAEPGQGSSTRWRRAAARHCAEHFLAGYNRVRIDAANVHAFFSSRGLDKGTTLVNNACFSFNADLFHNLSASFHKENDTIKQKETTDLFTQNGKILN